MLRALRQFAAQEMVTRAPYRFGVCERSAYMRIEILVATMSVRILQAIAPRAPRGRWRYAKRSTYFSVMRENTSSMRDAVAVTGGRRLMPYYARNFDIDIVLRPRFNRYAFTLVATLPIHATESKAAIAAASPKAPLEI